MSIPNEEADVNCRLSLAIELGNSELLDVHRWSEYPEVDNAVIKIYRELSTAGNSKIRKRHVKVLILDLYVKWLKDPTLYTSFYRGKWYYDDLRRASR